MLSKFEYERRSFDAQDEMENILNGLNGDIQAFSTENQMSKEDALTTTNETLNALKVLYANILKAAQTQTSLQSTTLTKLCQQMNLSTKQDKTINFLLLIKNVQAMDTTFEKILNVFKKSEPLETLFLRIHGCYLNNENFINNGETRIEQNSLLRMESNIYFLLVNQVLHPILDPVFIKFEDFFKILVKPDGVQIQFECDEEFKKNYFNLKDLPLQFDILDITWNKIKEEISNRSIDAYNEIEDQMDDFYDQINIYQGVFDLLRDKLTPSNVWEVDVLLPIIKQCIACFETTESTKKEINSLLIRIQNNAFESKKKLPPKIESQMALPPTKILATSSSTPLSKEPKLKEAEDTMDEDSTKAIKGTPKKTIEAIYSGSLKVTYKDLVTLVGALNGKTNEKTGSSARKLYLPNTTVFTHKRHGRDRAKYVDPKIIRQMKDILSALGINPENPRLVISSESNLAKEKSEQVKKRHKK